MHRRIPVYKTGQIIGYALVDKDDYAWVSQWRWNLQRSREDNFYIVRTKYVGASKRVITIYLHREILGLQHNDGQTGDHKDGNIWNNCRSNLRVVTNVQNAQNRRKAPNKFVSNYRGVTYDISKKRKRRWRADVQISGKRFFLGYFFTELRAARVANDFRLKTMPFAIDR